MLGQNGTSPILTRWRRLQPLATAITEFQVDTNPANILPPPPPDPRLINPVNTGVPIDSEDSKNSRCHEDQNQGNGEAVGSVGRRTRLRSPRPRHSRQLPLTPTITPLQFLLGVMRDPKAPTGLRVQVARAAAPLVHWRPKFASVEDRAGYASAAED